MCLIQKLRIEMSERGLIWQQLASPWHAYQSSCEIAV